MDVHDLDTYLLVGAGVLILAVLAVRLSVSIGLPSLLVYLALGLLLGSSGLGIDFADADLAHALGFGGLVLILAEGGLTTKWQHVRPNLGYGLLLATLGSAITVLVVAAGAHYLLDLDWELAVLLAAVLTPTDAAAVFSVLRTVPLKSSVTGTLEAESGLNDAPIVVLVVAISAGEVADKGVGYLAALVIFELLVGAAFGVAIGWFGGWLLRRVALPASGLYPLVVIAFTILAYGSAAAVHASGFAAVYIAALILGNAELPHRVATRSFVEGIGWLAQIGLFVMLGLLASPDELEWRNVWHGLLIGAILTFVARPLTVMVCAVWFRRSAREQLFVGWAGLRGAVPIVLATIPLSAGVDGSRDLFNTVFVAVVIYTLLQAAPLARLAAACGVLTDAARDVEVEAAPLERVSADLLQIRVPSGSRLAGVEVGELRLPVGASVTLVVRDETTFVPHRTDRIAVNDDLLIVAERSVREQTESRLRDVGRHGRLAGWGVDG
ncbi:MULTISPECIES: potassium/proton antiporter [Aeromicrobium]|uniref:Potassium/proton antiporter n=1 Tax=Aeromicrobium yanjiei TaxID=2662028 RepID=A0A5Q2MC27_9ACTN|nr:MULTISPECIES: potassium/proton antiporter [Aeromicrobium]MRK02507.1 potassium/proton antiporter [Aeromicrobium sp. S22]QGG40118.1 potassium/proton antiporter [Aeromicrobium yanjiei]